MQRTILSAAAVSLFCLLPGCIAWEIRDEMRTANSSLAGANWRLDEAGARMTAANQRLDVANERLQRVDERVILTQSILQSVKAELEKSNERLLAVEAELEKTEPLISTANARLEEMMVLQNVQKSLISINATLGPLGQSMSTMGSVVSMLGLGGEPEPAPAAAPSPAGAGMGAEGQPVAATAPDAPVPSGSAAPARAPNLLAGTWLLTFPVPPDGPAKAQAQQALVILSTGQFMLANGGMPLATGSWTQQGKTLTLTPTSPAPSAPGVGAPAVPVGQPPAPAPIVMEVLHNTPRQLSVKIGNDVRIYTRP